MAKWRTGVSGAASSQNVSLTSCPHAKHAHDLRNQSQCATMRPERAQKWRKMNGRRQAGDGKMTLCLKCLPKNLETRV